MADGLAEVINAGVLIGAPKAVPNGGLYAALPEGATLVDLERYMPAPAYVKATVAAKTAEAVTTYVNRHKNDSSAIFADVDAGKIVAVIDYHSAKNAAAHATHRVVYGLPEAEEWKTWNGADGRKMTQADFARFIEENRIDIVTPDGATVLEIARTLDARKKVQFKSGVRLEDGTFDIAYSEETTAAGGGISGKLSIPSEIEIGVPVFYGGPRYKLTCFFRYRIEDGRLQMWIDLHRKKHVRDHAFSEVVESIGAACEGVPLFEASI